jgi:release factor glutamine methyltransferase
VQARASGVESLDAQVMLAHLLGHGRTWILAHPEAQLDPAQADCFAQMVAHRQASTPVAYLIGEREFYGLPFFVSPDVLIPRPETEHLVEAALDWVNTRKSVTIADVGTGSGAIAVSLAVHLPDARVVATDWSHEALAVASRNTERHGVRERVMLVQADLMAPLLPPLDLIVSNPPYIPTAELAGLEVSRHEPHAALDGGPDGLAVVRRLLADMPHLLARPGLLLVEIGAGQGPAASTLAREAFTDGDVTVLRDYAGHDRVLRMALEATS